MEVDFQNTTDMRSIMIEIGHVKLTIKNLSVAWTVFMMELKLKHSAFLGRIFHRMREEWAHGSGPQRHWADHWHVYTYIYE